MNKIRIADRWVGEGAPIYFIADIAANHDGSLERAKKLIELAKRSGAHAAKFQNFQAPKIVSKYGFESLGGQISHQAKWKKSVFEVYKDASLPFDWTEKLYEFCKSMDIHYFSAPYDFEAVDMLEPYVPVYKVGSGDITWPEILRKIAEKGKPVILSTGASDLAEIYRAVQVIREVNPQLVLMQCNTNYTGSLENFKYINLNVLKTFQITFQDVVLGLSDHTPGHATVLGAVALGARVIEKHFTDDTTRSGPDHACSMTPTAWKDMVDRTRELEWALGTAVKKIENNERQTVIVQRRCLRAQRELKAGTVLAREMIDILRPAPLDAIFPYDIDRAIGSRLKSDIKEGDYFKWPCLEPLS
jgi:N-acetylneuraminate synthase